MDLFFKSTLDRNYVREGNSWLRSRGGFNEACTTWARFATAAAECRAGHAGRCLTVRNEDLAPYGAG